MRLKRRQFTALATGVTLGCARPRGAAAQADPRAASDYTAIAAPVPVATPAGTVDVVEFFSFACPHCLAFETPLEAWLERKAPEIRFRRSPVPFERNFRNFQAMYFALETLGLAGTMPRRIFDAVHKEHLRLDKPEDIAAFMARNGVDAGRFMDAFTASGIAAKVTQADQLFDASGAGSVPMMMVQGRFLTSPWMARGEARALAVVDRLAAEIRAEG